MEQEMAVAGSAGVAVAAVAVPSDMAARSSNSAELRVVYLATAADTSCVSHDDDSHQQTLAGADDNSQHVIMDIDGSDSDSNDDTEVTQHALTDMDMYGNASTL